MNKKFIIYSFITFLAAVSFLWLDYYLPKKTPAYITGSEVKRVDKDGPISATNPADGPTRDVYYIYTRLENGDVRVFRNEDTAWHWPLYFKFDSADVQAKSQNWGNQNKEVLISAYGWRFNMFSMFPNVIDIKAMDANPIKLSILRILCLGLWFFSVCFAFFRTNRWLKVQSHV